MVSLLTYHIFWQNLHGVVLCFFFMDNMKNFSISTWWNNRYHLHSFRKGDETLLTVECKDNSMTYIERMLRRYRFDWKFWEKGKFMVGKGPNRFRFWVASFFQALYWGSIVHPEACERIIKEVWRFVFKFITTNSLHKNGEHIRCFV